MGQIGAAGDPLLDTATTPDDHQQILAAHYINSQNGPIIKGGAVSGQGDLTYYVVEGVGMAPTASGTLEVNWRAGKTNTVSTPSVTRIDTVYADDLGRIKVAEGVAPPAGSCILEKMELPAGATNTMAAKNTYDKVYAMPYGADLGWLSMFIEPYTQDQWAIQQNIVWSTQRFVVPTDRQIQMRMHQCIYGDHTVSAGHTDFSNFGPGSMEYSLYIDNSLKRKFEVGYDRRWVVSQHAVDLDVNAGAHTLRLERRFAWGAAPRHFGSPDNIWQPGSVGIHDEGVRE